MDEAVTMFVKLREEQRVVSLGKQYATSFTTTPTFKGASLRGLEVLGHEVLFHDSSCTFGVQKNGVICLVVLQTAEILGLIICFAIHFLCVTIE